MVEVQEISQVLGLGLVATAPVAAGATVLDEEPLWTVSIEKIFNDHAFLQRKDVQAIVAAVAAGDTAPERANALMRLYAGHALSRLDDDVKAKVWRLADSIRDAQSGDRCLVSVGLEEDAVAGRFGDVVDVSDDGDERAICKVRLDNEEHDFPRWRLKTARGLWRTNAVEFQGVGYVYERLSRVNHACGRGANCERVFDGERCSLVATRSIKAGGELLLDYGDESERLLPPQTRRDRLFRAYGFACLCVDCRAAYSYFDAAELVNGDELRSVKSI